jgi:hypothetical protein
MEWSHSKSTSSVRTDKIDTGEFMAATGELIRLINYVDDITTTLRRISAFIPGLEDEERQKLALQMRVAQSGINDLLGKLEKVTQ